MDANVSRKVAFKKPKIFFLICAALVVMALLLVNTRSTLVPIKQKFILDATTTFVDVLLTSEYELPGFFTASSGQFSLENVALFKPDNQIIDAGLGYSLDTFSSLRTEPVDASGAAYLQELSIAPGSRIKIERTARGETRLFICGEYSGTVVLSGNVAVIAGLGQTYIRKRIRFNQLVPVNFRSKYSAVTGCTAGNRGIIDIAHDDNQSRDLGAFRVSEIGFKSFKEKDYRMSSDIKSGEISGLTLTDTPSLSVGDDIEFKSMANGIVRSLKYDYRTNLMELQLAGNAKDIDVIYNKVDGVSSLDDVSLSPSLFFYLMSKYFLFSLLLGGLMHSVVITAKELYDEFKDSKVTLH